MTPTSALDYAAAAARIAALQALDDETINPQCRTRLLSHGRKMPWALVFLHGYTNCPQQWVRFATPFFERGHNVFIPRLPHHGKADRFCDALAQSRASETLAFLSDTLDMAQGLGERVLLAGLSLSGVLALWAALMRADVRVSVSIAPQVLPRNVPPALMRPLIWIALHLPNFFIWWDPALKAAMPGPQHAYPRFALRGMAEMFKIAQWLQRAAWAPGALPKAGRTLLITNAYDPALDNRPAQAIITRWQANGARNAALYDFDASYKLIHDLIDEDQVEQRIAFVYPILMELIERQMSQAEREDA